MYLLLYCCRNIILLHTFYTSTFDLIAHLWITINYFCTLFTLAVKNIIKILLHTFHIYQRSTYFCTYSYIIAKNIIKILLHTFYTSSFRKEHYRDFIAYFPYLSAINIFLYLLLYIVAKNIIEILLHTSSFCKEHYRDFIVYFLYLWIAINI